MTRIVFVSGIDVFRREKLDTSREIIGGNSGIETS